MTLKSSEISNVLNVCMCLPSPSSFNVNITSAKAAWISLIRRSSQEYSLDVVAQFIMVSQLAGFEVDEFFFLLIAAKTGSSILLALHNVQDEARGLGEADYAANISGMNRC